MKAVVFDPEGRVLLVRHTYQPGWHFPGGGVKKGETVCAAAARELREETGIEAFDISKKPFGMYANLHEGKFDHVVLFVFEKWRMLEGAPKSGEIAEQGFFSRDALPEKTSRATLKRLAEIKDAGPQAEIW